MVDMAIHQILPAAMRYTRTLCDGAAAKHDMDIPARAEKNLITKLSSASDALYENVERLHNCLAIVPKDPAAAAKYYRSVIVPAMETVREEADILEALTDKSCWPYPTYSDLLFY